MRMNTLVALALVLSVSVLLSGCSLLKTTPAGVQVISNLPATVRIDGNDLGKTPYETTTLKPTKHTVVLIPTDTSYPKKETTLTLFPGYITQFDWSFAKTENESSGIAFEYEKAKKSGNTELQLVASPDNVPVLVDGENVGFTPLLIEKLSAEEHTVTFQAPGYDALERTIQLVAGTRTMVSAKLSKIPIATPLPVSETASESATPAPVAADTEDGVVTKKTDTRPYVRVEKTPTNFLRVRDSASASANELLKLSVGSTVPYANASSSGWLKVTYETGKTGWVSGQFATLFK